MPIAFRNTAVLTGLLLLLARCAFAVKSSALVKLRLKRPMCNPGFNNIPASSRYAGHVQLHFCRAAQCNVSFVLKHRGVMSATLTMSLSKGTPRPHLRLGSDALVGFLGPCPI